MWVFWRYGGIYSDKRERCVFYGLYSVRMTVSVWIQLNFSFLIFTEFIGDGNFLLILSMPFSSLIPLLSLLASALSWAQMKTHLVEAWQPIKK